MLSAVLTWTPQCPWFWMGVIRDRSSLSLSLFYGPKGKRENTTILIHTLKPNTRQNTQASYSISLLRYIQNLPQRTGMEVEFYILVVVKSFSACHCGKKQLLFFFFLSILLSPSLLVRSLF